MQIATLKIGTQCVHVSTATYLQMKQCKFICNDANTVRHTGNIRRENDPFNDIRYELR